MRIKTIYCIAMISVALILVSTSNAIGFLAAITLLIGALPMFNAISRSGIIEVDEVLDIIERRLIRRSTTDATHSERQD